MSQNRIILILMVISGLLGTACQNRQMHHLAPVTKAECSLLRRQHDQYRVHEGENLMSIAKRTGHQRSELAALNRLSPPYRLVPGQILRLAPKQKRHEYAKLLPPISVSDTDVVSSHNQNSPSSTMVRVSKNNLNLSHPTKLVWLPPIQDGKIVSQFQSNKQAGVRIANALGTPILATRAGTVVYSGSGLSGYGQLIIIKHDEHYLSAYGHNRRLCVGEGAVVAAGQKIAELGDSDASFAQLYFEIRRDGQPVDPLRYVSLSLKTK